MPMLIALLNIVAYAVMLLIGGWVIVWLLSLAGVAVPQRIIQLGGVLIVLLVLIAFFGGYAPLLWHA